MLNKKRKKVRIHNCFFLLGMILFSCPTHDMLSDLMLQYYGAEEHCEAEWGLNSRQDMENNRNRLTNNPINKSVIYVKMDL